MIGADQCVERGSAVSARRCLNSDVYGFETCWSDRLRDIFYLARGQWALKLRIGFSVDIDGGADDRCLGEQRDGEVSLGIADELLHHTFRLRIVGVAEVRCEPVVRREPHVVRGWDYDVRDYAAFEACHSVGEYFRWHSVDRGERFGDQCQSGGGFFVDGEGHEPPPRVGHESAEQMQTADGGPVDDQIVARSPHCWAAAAVLGPPFRFLLGDQAAEVAVRAVVAGGAGRIRFAEILP